MSQLLNGAGQPMTPTKQETCVLIFDMDGTLADQGHRQHHLTEDDSGWEAYFADMEKDEPIVAGATIFNLLATQCKVLGNLIRTHKLDDPLIYVDILTGRPERFRERTVAWMETWGFITPRALHMRPDDDHRPDNILKIEMYERLYKGKETVLAVFEDRERCVKAWRAAGVPCYQVAEGAF